MALYKDYTVSGKTITINTEGFSIIAQSDDALFLCNSMCDYMKISFDENGYPETRVSVRNNDDSRSALFSNWNERVTEVPKTTVRINAEPWSQELIQSIIDEIYKQTEHSKVKIVNR